MEDKEEILPPVPYEEPVEDSQAARDIEFARENIIDLITKGAEAIERMIDIAEQSQHPTSYKVLGELIKTVTETNKQLVELVKAQKEIVPKEETPRSQNIQNNLFVGSTAELQKFLTQMHKQKEEGIEDGRPLPGETKP